MKICIYGAGAIGGYMGVMLKHGGLDVSLVALIWRRSKTTA